MAGPILVGVRRIVLGAASRFVEDRSRAESAREHADTIAESVSAFANQWRAERRVTALISGALRDSTHLARLCAVD